MPTILEETTAKYTATVTDQDGSAVPAASLDTVHLTVYNKSDEAIIRTTLDALNVNGVTIDSNGALTWLMEPYETKITDRTIEIDDKEDHVALFEYSWNALKTNTLTDKITTTSGSSSVSIEDSAHGLSVDDHVIFTGADDVGGLEMDGLFLVTSITDPNNYVISHRSEATSSETGGGTFTYFYNGKVGKHKYPFKVQRVDVL